MTKRKSPEVHVVLSPPAKPIPRFQSHNGERITNALVSSERDIQALERALKRIQGVEFQDSHRRAILSDLEGLRWDLEKICRQYGHDKDFFDRPLKSADWDARLKALRSHAAAILRILNDNQGLFSDLRKEMGRGSHLFPLKEGQSRLRRLSEDLEEFKRSCSDEVSWTKKGKRMMSHRVV